MPNLKDLRNLRQRENVSFQTQDLIQKQRTILSYTKVSNVCFVSCRDFGRSNIHYIKAKKTIWAVGGMRAQRAGRAEKYFPPKVVVGKRKVLGWEVEESTHYAQQPVRAPNPKKTGKKKLESIIVIMLFTNPNIENV